MIKKTALLLILLTLTLSLISCSQLKSQSDLAGASITSPENTANSILDVKILDISFYDMNGNKLQTINGWIQVQKNTKIEVTYTGNADQIDYIFTPSGSETYNLQRIIGNSFVGPNDTKAEFIWSPSSDQTMGYITVSINQGRYSVKSNDINVVYQP